VRHGELSKARKHVALPASTICALYKSRLQVELFFKWIKQHRRIKQFYGTSENAAKTQIGSPCRFTCWSPSFRCWTIARNK
jgi:IS4 transposase